MAYPKPTKIAGTLQQTLRRLGLEQKMINYQFCLNWSAIVGEELSELCQPESIKQNTLFVTVPSSIWAQELSMQSELILGRLKPYLNPGQQIDQVRFIVKSD